MPTIRIDDEVWSYLKSKATPFEDTPNDVLRRELKLTITEKPSPKMESADSDRIRLAPGGDFSHKQLMGFRLDWLHKEGEFMTSRSFSDMLQTLSNLLILHHMETFSQIALKLHGKRRPYFSQNPAELRKPQKLIGIYVETNLSANSIVAICRVLLERLGYDPNSLKLQFQ